jgi:hypothetical protein
MTNSQKSHFLLVLRTPQDRPDLSPEEMQRSLERGIEWIRAMKTSGHYVSGDPLGETGHVLRGKHGRQMSDGPFVEGKEIVAGYVLIVAQDLATAIEVARACPGLERDASVEIRPIEMLPEVC